MSIFSRLFKSRDKPQNSYDSPSYTYFFGRANSGKRVTDRTALWFMPVCVCCQKRLHSCHCICTNITIKEKSECHGIRFIFCSTISQILK